MTECIVIYTPTGDCVGGPCDVRAAYRQHKKQSRHTAVLLTTDERLAHSEQRGYYIPAGITVRAGVDAAVWELVSVVEQE
jgi:hypothetical protein